MTKGTIEFSTGLPLSLRIETLQRLSRWTRHHFDIWRVFTGTENREPVERFDENYPAFSALDEHGHRTLALLYLNALFERNAKTINIPGVLAHYLRQTPKSATLEALKENIEAAYPLVSKVARIRGNAIAHRTIKKRHDEIYEDAQLTVDQLDGLIGLSEQASDTLAVISGMPPWPPMHHPADDLRKILAIL